METAFAGLRSTFLRNCVSSPHYIFSRSLTRSVPMSHARSASGIKSCRLDNLFDNYGFCQAEALLIKLVYTSHQVYYTCARGSKLGRSHRQGARSAIQATGLCYAWLTTALHRARLLSVFAPIVAKIDNIVRRAHPPVILNRPSKSFE